METGEGEQDDEGGDDERAEEAGRPSPLGTDPGQRQTGPRVRRIGADAEAATTTVGKAR